MSTEVKARIEEQLKSHDVLLYMKGSPDFPQCGFSGQVVAALKAIGKPFSYFNILEDPDIREGLADVSATLREGRTRRRERHRRRDVSFR